ncbi:MAG: hypothetical protein H6970_05075 [Gammaproteobacteria bacterium]|nr:hypothetical protein [Gammaproteobacteria bacterium]MCP5424423.1 hypothetical protein [Gammaproteobacteria bacterium]MCP5458417.1 hypothetical protein [Gammaproteobacteria bacterium]
MNPETIDRELDLKIAAAMGIEIYFNDWDARQEIPLYIPSGKSWKTHSMEARPLPSYHKNYGAAFSLLDLFKNMAGFKLERGLTEWWWCGIEFISGLSAKGEGITAPIAICNAILSGLTVYPIIPMEKLNRETLMEMCKKRHVKSWTAHSSKKELMDLLAADEQTMLELMRSMMSSTPTQK